MEGQQAQKVNEAARQFAEALTESYEKVSDHSVSAQALNAELTQGFFNAVVSNLYRQAESNREMTQELIEQARRGQEVSQTMNRRIRRRMSGRNGCSNTSIKKKDLQRTRHTSAGMFTK